MLQEDGAVERVGQQWERNSRDGIRPIIKRKEKHFFPDELERKHI